MLRRSCARCFFVQQAVPIVPQGVLPPSDSESAAAAANSVLVGYLLTRQPSVQHALHPLEQEMGFLLEREYSRYCRHSNFDNKNPDAESATAFFAARGLALDSWNRQDKTAIQKDYFNLDTYREATRVTLERYSPAKRIGPADFFDPFAEELKKGPPARRNLQRRLEETMLLIVKDAASGKWTVPAREVNNNNNRDGAAAVAVPAASKAPRYSLRTAVEQALLADHSSSIDAYIFGNAPQGVLQWGEGQAPLPRGASSDDSKQQLFIYIASYLSGRPNFEPLEQRRPQNVADHAWVTRSELADYEFAHPDMYSLLRDVTLDTSMRT